MALGVDGMLRKIGEFGNFQVIFICIMGYSLIGTATNMMVVVFITAEPEWVCAKGYNGSVCNFTEPISLTSKHYKARCSMPREAWTYIEEFTSTVTEFDLVCERSVLQSVAQSCFWPGMFLGLIVAGYLSDRFGRRKILCSGLCLMIMATWIMVFPKYFIVFIIFRIITGFGIGFRNATGFVLLTEFTTEKHRAKIGLLAFYFWFFGLLLLPLIGYFLREWRWVLLIAAAIATPCLFWWWLIPESPRWLLVRGKEKQARLQLARVARINGSPFPDEELQHPGGSERYGNLKDLFYDWKVAKTTLVCWDLWFTTALVYYAVSYGSVDLGGNRYLNFALSVLVELPANITSIWSINRFGRKKIVIFGLALASLSSVITFSIPADRTVKGHQGARIFVAVMAKFFAFCAFGGLYVWTAELFPTFVRTMGFSSSSAAGRLGSFTASYIIWLIRIHRLLPFGIVGAVCLQGAILATLLPETNGRSTLETMNDMMETEVLNKKDDVDAQKSEADGQVCFETMI